METTAAFSHFNFDQSLVGRPIPATPGEDGARRLDYFAARTDSIVRMIDALSSSGISGLSVSPL